MAKYRIWVNKAVVLPGGYKDPVNFVEMGGVRKLTPPIRILGECWFETDFNVPQEEPRVWIATDGPIEPDPFK